MLCYFKEAAFKTVTSAHLRKTKIERKKNRINNCTKNSFRIILKRFTTKIIDIKFHRIQVF